MVDQIAIPLPLWVRSAREDISNVVPALPTLRCSRNDACGQSTRNGDVNLLATLHPAYETRRILTEFSESDGGHRGRIAQMLLNLKSTTASDFDACDLGFFRWR